MAGLHGQMPGCLPLKLQMGEEENPRGPPSRKHKRNPPKPQQSWKVLSFFFSISILFNGPETLWKVLSERTSAMFPNLLASGLLVSWLRSLPRRGRDAQKGTM